MRRQWSWLGCVLILFGVAHHGAAVASAVATEPFTVSADSEPAAQMVGELWRVPAGVQARGTLFMCHGFARSMWDTRDYRWIAEHEHWNVVRFDFREHGGSSHRTLGVPTLGYREIWDLKAVIDWAEAQGLAKPYACYGHSMGAAIALRWAGEDRRIVGVLAQSSFRNALDAAHKYNPDDKRIQLASALLLHEGLRGMLEQVDIPAAVAKRDDLRLWLSAGEFDYFPKADQRAILDASPSPERLKKLVIIPGGGHGDHWRWPGNDDLIRNFLDASADRPIVLPIPRGRSASLVMAISATVAVAAVGFGGYLLLRRHRRHAA